MNTTVVHIMNTHVLLFFLVDGVATYPSQPARPARARQSITSGVCHHGQIGKLVALAGADEAWQGRWGPLPPGDTEHAALRHGGAAHTYINVRY